MYRKIEHVIAYIVLCACSAAFLTQTICLDDTVVKFEIWDTAGQERYHSLAPMYYRGAQAAIVMYDITNKVYTVHSFILWLTVRFEAWQQLIFVHCIRVSTTPVNPGNLLEFY